MYVQINLGRSVKLQGFGTFELSVEKWRRLQLDVESALVDFSNALRDAEDSIKSVELHEGRGNYADVEETSAHLSIYFEDHTRIDSVVEEYIGDLALDLAGILDEFGQESVCLIIAGSRTNNGDRAQLITRELVNL